MRRFDQKKILELLQTLNEANAELKLLFLQGEDSAVLQVLADCQDFVTAICDFIVGIEGEGTQTVALLGEYYGSLYQASLAVEQKGSDKFWKSLKKQLIKIENNVKTELKPNKLEVVFFPYNASMWDSLESVWLEAKDDPCCDAYVVPIPYYELAPNGTFGKMHYEGGKYPENVPITNWQEYDIAARRPDVVFIHYAYDDAARNASIHPDFYSKRLREYCDLLVYIPYFVVAGAYVEDYYTTLPGVLYADRVILQSEEQRQSYIDQYKHYDKQNSWNGRYGNPTEKFVALGSPKFDKVLNVKRDDYSLPEGWEQLLYREDGTTKKVILYNTHMFTWINGGEPYFKKLESVFECFRSREDVVLWWRPHPNTELNFRRFRPELFDRYMWVVQEYKEAGWGIYDDTSDLHRAITVSDAYYGDASSVVTLYAATGKPVMIANMKILSSADEIELIFEVLCDGADYLWCVPVNMNSLFRISKETWTAEHIGFFENEKFASWRAFLNVIMVNDRLIFAPYSADNITGYSLASDSFKCSPIKKPKKEGKVKYNPECKFSQVFHCGDSLFFIPHTYPGILRYDLITGKVKCYSGWIKDMERLIKKAEYGYFYRGVLLGDKLFLAGSGANAVLEFDVKDFTHRIHEVRSCNTGYVGICSDGEYFWMAPIEHGAIVKWNPQEGVVKECGYNVCNDSSCKPFPYQNISYENGNVFVLPASGNCAFKLNIRNDTVTILDVFQSECEQESSPTQPIQSKYLLQEIIDGEVYGYSTKTNRLMAYNTKTGETRRQTVFVSNEDSWEIGSEQYRRRQRGIVNNDTAIFQENTLSLKDYLRCVIEDTGETCTKCSVSRAGKNIYECVRKAVNVVG
ncbi:hypothetical protein Desdi_2901 [Desulfitobacterium dichloroeliminans LMG P-21439]|uniref:CDP-Glycerol:Poly(Glycerophosphate) glycerophosphotransferase n=1 Tax=Desulfitobacterium dichloroeliminans (strain LMG P-21439 / DCA1) TaxID=871963 RepID=L0FBI6_DESDL|nr:hypothetical protein [Desulfitobacterium dichloroeliminans]AGA70313.1 hypothetical protein Desdi_2901 [Desulfitobacterium dichloroeliminans LMG P-21439]